MYRIGSTSALQRLACQISAILATCVAGLVLTAPPSSAGLSTTATTISLARGPWAVAATPSGDRVFVSSTGGNVLSVIDTATDTVIASRPLGRGPWSLDVDPSGDLLYVALKDSGELLVIDTATFATVRTIYVGGSLEDVEVFDSKAYAVDVDGNRVRVVDLATGLITGDIPVGTRPESITATPSGTKAYVSNLGPRDSLVSGEITVLDVSADAVTARLPIEGVPGRMAATESKVYVTNKTTIDMSVIDTASDTLEYFGVPTRTGFVSVSPAETEIYVSAPNSGKLIVIDTATKERTAIFGANNPAHSVVAGSRLYLAQYGSSSVTVRQIFGLFPGRQELSLTAGQPIQATPALEANGFDGPVDLAVSPALPAGLSLAPNGAISGTPTTAQSAGTYRITATDGSSSATATVSISIAATVSPASQSVSGAAGQPITATSALTPAGLIGTVVYAASPALPPGLNLDTTTGVVSGTPTSAQASTSYTITATGSASGSVTATVTVAVDPAMTPTTQSVSGQSGEAITPTTALTPVGFPSTPTYAVSPALPGGLELDPDTGVVSGTPTASQLAQTYTITGTGGGFSATTELVVAVSALSPATQTVTGTQGEAITPTEAYVASDFVGAVTYTSDPLPAGLELDPDTGVISGTPSGGAQAATDYVVTATGATPGSAKATVTISVAPVLSGVTTSVQGTVGEEITPTTPPTTDGFPGTVTYSTDPALPDGLSLDPDTGVISGTPTAALASMDVTLTATDGDFSETATVTIQIAGLTAATQTVSAVHGTAITATGAFTAVGFTGAVSYVVDAPLPDGLTFDAATGVISGTPTGAAQAATTYTVTGSGESAGTASATIEISVAAVAPGAATSVVATPGANQAIIGWDAPADDGGDGPITYTVTSAPGDLTCTTTGTSCLITGLAPGATTFSVVATTPSGSSVPAVAAPVTVVGTVAPETVPSATAGLDVDLTNAAGDPVTSVKAGQQITATATGFYPGSLVEIHVYSVPEPLGVAQADATGTAVLPVTFSSNAAVAPGVHTLVASGFTPAGVTGHGTSNLTVVADAAPPTPGTGTPPSSGGSVALPDGTLPATGAPELPSTWTGLRLILLGAMALAVAAHLRRREAG